MSTATDKLQWILEFKSQGISALKNELKTAETSVKRLTSAVKLLNTAISKKHTYSINVTRAESAIDRLSRKVDSLNQKLAKSQSMGGGGLGSMGAGRSSLGGGGLRNLTVSVVNKANASSKAHFAGSGVRNLSAPALNSMGGGSSGSGGGAGSLLGGMAGGVGGAVMGAVAAGAVAVNAFKDFMKESIDVIAEKESIMRNYTVQLGSKEAAEAEYKKAAAFSQKTDLTFQQATEIQQRLINAGFRNTKDNKMLDKGLYAVSDLAALQPQNQREGFITQISAALTKTAQRGYLTTKAVDSMSLKGVRQADLYESIRKQMGLGKDADVRSMISKGQIGANVGLEAFFQATLAKTKTSKLGEYSVGAAGTLGGIMSNIGEAKDNIIRSIDFDQLGGFKDFKNFLKDIADNLNVFEGKGEGVREVIANILNFGFGVITFIGKAVKDVFGFLYEVISSIASNKTFMTTMAYIKKILVDVFAIVKDVISTVWTVISTVGSFLYSLIGPVVEMIIKRVSLVIDFIRFVVGGYFAYLRNSFKFVFGILKKVVDAIWSVVRVVDDKFMYVLKVAFNFFKMIGNSFAKFFEGLWDMMKLKFKQGKDKMAEAFKGEDIIKKTNDEIAAEKAKEQQAKTDELKKTKENAQEQENLIKDNIKGGKKNAAGGGMGGGTDKVGKVGDMFRPNFEGGQFSHLRMGGISALQAAPMTAFGMMPTAKPILTPATAVAPTYTNNVPVTLNFEIHGDNKTDEIAQKVEVALTRVFGRITTNPTPGVL